MTARPTANRPCTLYTTMVVVCTLSSCSGNVWNRDYRLRFWEKYRIAAETAYLKKDYQHAHQYSVQAVKEAEDLGARDFRLGVSLAALGDACRKLGDHAEAEANYDRALVVLKNALKVCENDKVMTCLVRQDLARVLNSMGQMYNSEKKYELAASHFEHAVKLYDELCVPMNGHYDDNFLAQEEVRTLTALAKVYGHLKEFDKADASFRKALAEARLADLPELASQEITRDYLELMQSTGRQNQVLDVMALVAWQEGMNQVVELCNANRWPEAEVYLKNCLAATKQFPDRPECLAKTLAQLATVYVKTGRIQQAEASCNDAMQVLATSADDAGFDVDSAMTSLGMHYSVTQQGDKALPLLMNQYGLRARLFGVHSVQSAEILAGLADAFRNAGNFGRASQAADRARQILLPAYAGSKRGIPAMFELGKCYQLMGDYARAQEMFKAALEAALRRCQPCDMKVISIRQYLFQTCLQQKKYKEAEDQFNAMSDAVKGGALDDRIRNCPYLLLCADTYFQLGMYEQTAKCLALAGKFALDPKFPSQVKSAVQVRLRGFEKKTGKKILPVG